MKCNQNRSAKTEGNYYMISVLLRMWQRSTTFTAACTLHILAFVAGIAKRRRRKNQVNIYKHAAIRIYIDLAWKFMHKFAWGNRKSVCCSSKNPYRVTHTHRKTSISSECSIKIEGSKQNSYTYYYRHIES